MRPCVALSPEIARWQSDHAEALTIGAIEAGHRLAAGEPDEFGRADVLLQSNDEVGRAYGVQGTPTAVLVDPRGKILSDLAAWPEAIRQLVASGTGERPAAAPVARGESFAVGRREFLVRLAGAGATLGLVLAMPARAVAGVRAVGARCGCGRSPRC